MLGIDGPYEDLLPDAGPSSSGAGGTSAGGASQGGSGQGGSGPGGSGGSAGGSGGQGGIAGAAGATGGSSGTGGTCPAGHADCDSSSSNGCETDIVSDVDHCGQCTTACPTAPNTTRTCSNSACGLSCSSGWKDCDGSLGNGCEQSGARYADEVLADGPIGYWRLGEATGTTATDASGHGHDLTYHDGVNQGIAGALHCDTDKAAGFVSSAQGYVFSAPVTALEPTSSITLELWLLQTGSPAANEKVLYYSYANADPWGSWGLQRTGTAQSGFSFMLNLGNKSRWLNTTSVSAKDIWYHVVMTYNGALMSLYLNGALDASTAGTGAIGYNHGAWGLAVGAWANPQSFFTGSVDEVAIYDKPLSATRIAAHYQAGKQ